MWCNLKTSSTRIRPSSSWTGRRVLRRLQRRRQQQQRRGRRESEKKKKAKKVIRKGCRIATATTFTLSHRPEQDCAAK